jgi:hypothetical protein
MTSQGEKEEEDGHSHTRRRHGGFISCVWGEHQTGLIGKLVILLLIDRVYSERVGNGVHGRSWSIYAVLLGLMGY